MFVWGTTEYDILDDSILTPSNSCTHNPVNFAKAMDSKSALADFMNCAL
jgi:hypothetical protein